ncbi:MAG: phosphomannomutase, partial [Desulfovibrio sp.]|nr:phosphomannomutase [Desulfovibrio sp.]
YNADAIIDLVQQHYAPNATLVDTLDGINLEFKDWRFNLRKSNTEPLLRLNLETRGNKALMQDKTDEILQFIEKHNQ